VAGVLVNLERLAESLDAYVRPQTHPLFVRFLGEGEPIPERARRPSEAFGHGIATCQAIGIARRYGWSVAMLPEDFSCALSYIALGMDEPPREWLEGHACLGMYAETLEAGAKMEEAVHRFEPSEFAGLVVAPIHRVNFEPHLFVQYGNPAQAMRLVQASLWKRGGRVTTTVSGRLDCADITVGTYKSGEPQVIVPCYGDRVFGGVDDDEVAFAAPAGMVDEIAEGLAATHKAGVRYPIPKFLRYDPQFPEKYDLLWEKMGKP
jgi:uncharacterized protein (DUF169 family)